MSAIWIFFPLYVMSSVSKNRHFSKTSQFYEQLLNITTILKKLLIRLKINTIMSRLLHIRFLFTGEHVFLLEPMGEEKTRLIHKEKFEGIFIPFAKLDAIEEGYDLMNRALKERMEKGPVSR